jgi:hypothetical protein
MRDEDGRAEYIFLLFAVLFVWKMFEGNKKNNEFSLFAKITHRNKIFLLINRIGCCVQGLRRCSVLLMRALFYHSGVVSLSQSVVDLAFLCSFSFFYFNNVGGFELDHDSLKF